MSSCSFLGSSVRHLNQSSSSLNIKGGFVDKHFVPYSDHDLKRPSCSVCATRMDQCSFWCFQRHQTFSYRGCQKVSNIYGRVYELKSCSRNKKYKNANVDLNLTIVLCTAVYPVENQDAVARNCKLAKLCQAKQFLQADITGTLLNH